jgi:hypothetical protein
VRVSTRNPSPPLEWEDNLPSGSRWTRGGAAPSELNSPQQGGAARVLEFREQSATRERGHQMRWASRRATEFSREGENKGKYVIKEGKIWERESAIRAKREDDALFRQVRPLWYSASSGEGRDETL